MRAAAGLRVQGFGFRGFSLEFRGSGLIIIGSNSESRCCLVIHTVQLVSVQAVSPYTYSLNPKPYTLHPKP